MKNTFMTLVYSKVLHTGRHPLREDSISQRGLDSLNLFSSSTICSINTFQIRISYDYLETSLLYPSIFYQIVNCILQEITGLNFIWDHKYHRLF